MFPHRLVLLAIAAVSLLGLAAPAGYARSSADCTAGSTLAVVAHEDDSFLFMDPDLRTEVAAGRCVRTVFLTAGDAGLDQSYWSSRELGAQAAHANLAGRPNAWQLGDAGIPGHPAPLLTLQGNPRVSLVFLRLPDGQSAGAGFPSTGNVSLEKLWLGTVPSLTTVDGTSTYTRDALISALLSQMQSFAPQTVRAQDFLGGFGGGDHSDHRAGARFVKAAGELYPLRHSLVGYVGNGIAAMQNNLSPAATAAKQATFLAYAPFDSTICHTAEECVGSIFASWWSREYVLTTETQGTVLPPPPPVVKKPLTKAQKLKAFCHTHSRSPRCRHRPIAKP